MMVAVKRGAAERAWRQASRHAIEEMIALEASASVALDNDPDYQTLFADPDTQPFDEFVDVRELVATPETARWDRINKLVAAEAAAIKGRAFTDSIDIDTVSAGLAAAFEKAAQAITCALAACRPGRCDHCGAYGPTHVLSLYTGGHGYRVTSFCCPELGGTACDARQTAGWEARE